MISWTVAHQAPLSMVFPRQEYWSIPFSRGIFPTQRSNPGLLHCRRILYCLSHKLSGSLQSKPCWFSKPITLGAHFSRTGPAAGVSHVGLRSLTFGGKPLQLWLFFNLGGHPLRGHQSRGMVLDNTVFLPFQPILL